MHGAKIAWVVVLCALLGCQDNATNTRCGSSDACPEGFECDPEASLCRRVDTAFTDAAAPDTTINDVAHPDHTAPDASTFDASSAEAGRPDSASSDGGPQSDFQLLLEAEPVVCTNRRTITIDGDHVSQPLPAFPALFDSVVDPALMLALRQDTQGGQVLRQDGEDILFAAGDGLEALPHEIERYLAASGRYIAWVRVDLTGQDQTLYLYFGCDVTASTERPAEVWDADFLGVWHLSETGSSVGDSTGQLGAGAVIGASSITQAVVAGGFSYDLENDDRIEIPSARDQLALTAFTAEIWVKTALAPVADEMYLLSQPYHCEEDGAENAWSLAVTDDSSHEDELRFEVFETGECDHTYGSVLTDGDWHHVAGVRQGGRLYAYVDGELISEGADSTGGALITSSAPLLIGGNSCVSEDFTGVLDEARISSGARSPGWIAATHANLRDPAAFYSISP